VVVQLNICSKSFFGCLCRFDGDGYVALIHCWFWFFLYSSLHIYIETHTHTHTHERSSSYDVMVFVHLTSYVLCPNALYNVKPNQSNACLFHNFLLVVVDWMKCLVFSFLRFFLCPGLSIIVYLVLLGIVSLGSLMDMVEFYVRVLSWNIEVVRVNVQRISSLIESLT